MVRDAAPTSGQSPAALAASADAAVRASPRYAVLGAGSWGTCLALHLGRAGMDVSLWPRDPHQAREIAAVRENRRYLPGHLLPASVRVSGELEETLSGATRVIIAVPSQHCRPVLRSASGHLGANAVLVVAAKGIETGTLAVVTSVAREEMGERPAAVLSGPSFAIEVARGDPTAVVIASDNPGVALALQREISHGTLRLYTNGDPLGVQLAGALKNVFAVAAGVIGGLGFGSNTAAALITRSLAEMRRLGVALCGRPETFEGLAGLGDLVLTCTGALSRNRRLGEQLARGRPLPEILSETTQVVEGVETSISARDLAMSQGVEMPIVAQVHAVLHEGRPPREAISDLMSRRLRGEEEA